MLHDWSVLYSYWKFTRSDCRGWCKKIVVKHEVFQFSTPYRQNYQKGLTKPDSSPFFKDMVNIQLNTGMCQHLIINFQSCIPVCILYPSSHSYFYYITVLSLSQEQLFQFLQPEPSTSIPSLLPLFTGLSLHPQQPCVCGHSCALSRFAECLFGDHSSNFLRTMQLTAVWWIRELTMLLPESMKNIQ